MPEKSFKANIYDVEVDDEGPDRRLPFADAIQRAGAETLENRVRNVSGKDRRLDNIDKVDGCFRLNFTTFEFSGPGRVRRPDPAMAIGLHRDESFSNETAALYDRDNNLVFLEAMRGGMSSGAIARYFREFGGEGAEYILVPRLDDDAAARARKQQVVRKVIMRVALGPAASADRRLGVGAIEAFGEEFGARSIDLEIKAGPERSHTLILERVRNFLGAFAERADDDVRIERLRLAGKEHDDDPLEIIDLLQHRECRERVLQVDEDQRKIVHTERWSALSSIRQEFLRDVALD